MCTRFKNVAGIMMFPGKPAVYNTSLGIKNGIWGFDKGRIYNARVERLNEYWEDYRDNRGVLDSLSFFEKGYEISIPGVMHIPIIYNSLNEFSILTTESKGLLIPIHHRQPIILMNDPDEWLKSGKILEYVIAKAS